MIFVVFFDIFFVDFMFNFVSWPGRPDKRRTHTEHTQSTRRALERQPNRKEPKWLCEVYGNSQKDFETHIRTNMRTQSHEDSHEDAHEDSHEDSHEGSHEYR